MQWTLCPRAKPTVRHDRTGCALLRAAPWRVVSAALCRCSRAAARQREHRVSSSPLSPHPRPPRRRQSRKFGDWREYEDPSSAKKYYYNKKTGETTWSKPRVLTLWQAHADGAAGHKNGKRQQLTAAQQDNARHVFNMFDRDGRPVLSARSDWSVAFEKAGRRRLGAKRWLGCARSGARCCTLNI